MEIEQFIDVRLQLLNSIEPKSAVEDVLFYTYEGSDAINIALLPIEGLRQSLDKEIARKMIVRKLLSKSFFQTQFKNPESIEYLILFSIDSLTEIDHCFFINAQTLQYEYCAYDFRGNILLARSYKLSNEANDMTAIDFTLSKNDVYFPSAFIESFFAESINKIILEDQRTRSYSSPLGHTVQEIRAKILNFGLADFDQPYQSLSPVDKVNLYCYLNLKKHYFTTYALMERFTTSMDPLVDLDNLNFIDIGCGPLTSALAIADIYANKTKGKLSINYYGIDTAKVMIDKARLFSLAGCFGPDSSFNFATKLEDLDLRSLVESDSNKGKLTIINCSYLFASKTLNVKYLSDQLKQVENTKGDLYLLYQNSIANDKNSNWISFQGLFDLIQIYSAEKTIYYHNRRSISAARKEEKVRFEISKIITYDYAV